MEKPGGEPAPHGTTENQRVKKEDRIGWQRGPGELGD